MVGRFCVVVAGALLATISCLADGDLNARQGKVTTPDGKPIAGAIIRTVSASSSVREDQICPSVYPGLGKTYTTDENGEYQLEELHPRLRYLIAISAPGYKPHVIEEMSAWVTKPLSNTLQPAPEKLDAAQEVTGHVQDDNGKPLPGAVIEFFGEQYQGGEEFGRIKDVDTYAVTGDDGVFVCQAKGDHRRFFTKVFAYGFSPQVVRMQAGPNNPADNDVNMSKGSNVSGRLVKDGQPLAGVKMVLSQVNMNAEQSVGFFSTGTDADGRFVFEHLPVLEVYQVRAAMNSLGSRGATAETKIETGAPGQVADLGDVTVGPSVTISGKCILPEGVEPKGITVWVSPSNYDSATTTIDADGTFKIPGIPPGSVSLSVSGGSVELSPDNVSYYAPVRRMTGTVDHDMALVLKLAAASHGPHSMTGYSPQEYELKKTQILEGVSEGENK